MLVKREAHKVDDGTDYESKPTLLLNKQTFHHPNTKWFHIGRVYWDQINKKEIVPTDLGLQISSATSNKL